jgi:hypothetical protein
MRTSIPNEIGLSSNHISRYQVIEESGGFRVEGKDRITVHVSLSQERTMLLITDEENPSPALLGLYAYRSLLVHIAQRTMRHWTQPDDRPVSSWGGIDAWAQKQTQKALASRVYQHWQSLLTSVPDPVRSIAKAVFVATGDALSFGCETWPELYQYPHLVQDIVQYRAAASLCRLPLPLLLRTGLLSNGSLLSPLKESQGRLAALYQWYISVCEQHWPFWKRDGFLTIEGEYAQFDRDWSSPHLLNQTYLDLLSQGEARHLLLDTLTSDWKACYSSTGVAYRSLNRTLMNLPGGMPVALLSYLPTLHLSRPVTQRVELLTLLLFAHVSGLPDPALCWEYPIFAQANRDEILRARTRYAAYQGWQLRSKTVHLRSLVYFLHDYCLHHAPHRCSLPGLLDRAIRWDQQVRGQTTLETNRRLGAQKATKRPPIPLPDTPSIRWLATVGEVVAEGKAMSNCLATYAESAVSGNCYLFRIDYNEMSAAVQVTSWGEVLQAYGPGHTLNEAADYGRLMLSRWGKRLKQWEKQQRIMERERA